MPRRRSRLRVVAWCAAALAGTALPLGLVAPPEARASCVGPQLVLVQDGATVTPRPAPEGVPQDVVHEVRAGEDLVLRGRYLTTVCNDTISITQVGCSPPQVDDGDPVVPLADTRLAVVQQGRVWELGTFGDIGADLEATAEVLLPDDLRPGPAELTLSEGDGEPVTTVALQVR